MFAYYAMDYTLNRITLFALVFVTGIVVDDSIIIAENMHRHFKMKKMSPLKANEWMRKYMFEEYHKGDLKDTTNL